MISLMSIKPQDNNAGDLSSDTNYFGNLPSAMMVQIDDILAILPFGKL
jgi:hypothetical protein